jgi:hypothetical protein
LLRARLPLIGVPIGVAALAMLLAGQGLASAATAASGVVVTPATAANSGQRGQIVNYALKITNTGSATDIFTLTISGYRWPTDMFLVPGTGIFPSTELLVSLSSGDGQDVQIRVHVPVTATGHDVVTFRAVSGLSPAISASATLTTSVFLLYLPLIMRRN